MRKVGGADREYTEGKSMVCLPDTYIKSINTKADKSDTSSH